MAAQDDCYRLVTVYGEELGSRLPKPLFNLGESIGGLLEFLGVRNLDELRVFLAELAAEANEAALSSVVERPYHPYYDKTGQPIDVLQHMLLHDNPNYHHILDSKVYPAEGHEKGVRISTIWTGMNTRSFGLPDIFETKILSDFGDLDPDDDATWAWPTLEEAWRGHFEICDKMMERGPGSVLKMRWWFMDPKLQGPFGNTVPAWLREEHDKYADRNRRKA